MNLFANDLPMVAVDKRNTSPTVEVGKDLLNRLLATRRVRWEQKELDRLKAENKKISSDQWKSKYRPPTVLQERPSATLPESWVWVSAETACESVRDGTHDTPKYVNEGIPLVTSKDLTGGRIDFAKTNEISEVDHLEISKRSYVENGDVLFAMIGTVGNPLVVNADRTFSIKNVGLFKKNHLFLESRYLKYWLESPSLIKWLTPRLKGSNQKFAPSLPVPLAPLSDQKRIVAEIEKQFTRLEAGVAGLRRVQANLKRYRAAVLKTACEGKLVPTEADLARREGRTYETGAQLLDRILIERRQKWNGKGKYKEPAKPDLTKPSLPDGWVCASVEQITDNFDGRRVPLKSTERDKRSGPYPYYGASGIIDDIDDYLFNGEYLLIAEDGANLLSRSTPIAFKASGKFWVNNHAHIVQTAGGIPLAFLGIFLNGQDLKFFITGSAQPKLTQAALNRIFVPLPPYSEQLRIVAEVERRLSVVEELEVVVNTSLQRATGLRQSILQRAFEGTLIP